MPLNRPVPQSWKSKALGPGFSVNGINAFGLDQHVPSPSTRSRKSTSSVSAVGLAWPYRGTTTSTQAMSKERSIGLERGNEG